MKMLRIVLIVATIGLFAFSIQARISAQNPGGSIACEGTIEIIEDYEYWDEMEVECAYCHETGRKTPVFDPWNNPIGYEYERIAIASYVNSMECQPTDFENRYCERFDPRYLPSDECDPIFKPY